MKKILLILANSVKHHKHCIAGKDIETKQWIRPVDNDSGKELSYCQIKYHKNGSDKKIKPLDIVKIRFLKACPLLHQPENMVIANEKWENVEPQKLKIIPVEYLDSPKDLWGNSEPSISCNLIEQGKLEITQSLYLIKVENLNLYINKFDGRRKRRSAFRYNNQNYDLAVTDPNFDRFYDKKTSPTQCILCISLGENFNRYHYKLIAGIF